MGTIKFNVSPEKKNQLILALYSRSDINLADVQRNVSRGEWPCFDQHEAWFQDIIVTSGGKLGREPILVGSFRGMRDLRALTEADLDIVEIASVLAKINRFAGHTRFPFSVATHSVLVSSLCPAGYKLAGLMHDVTEAFVGDLISPLKNAEFKVLEADVLRQLTALRPAWFANVDHTTVKEADREAYRDEAAALQGTEPCGVDIYLRREYPWQESRTLFLDHYKALT